MKEFDPRPELKNIPQKPGIYQFWSETEELIYIGKAKNLKNRVSSYFNKDNFRVNAKTRILVSKIRKITFTIVDTEIDAWLLENSLIKKHQPRYNVMLKDDKTYPWIIIKNEKFPRIFWTRRIIRDGSTYFGPYASVGMMHTILGMIKEIYPLRTCTLPLTRENIHSGKFRVCLEYQIGNCKGPCQAYQSEDDYDQSISEIKEILNGKTGSVIRRLKNQLEESVSGLNFELAHNLKQKLDLLDNYQSKSTIVNSSITDVDVFSIATDDKHAFVNFLKVMNGTVIQTQTLEIKKRLDESDEELLSIAITEFRSRFDSNSKEIIIPFELEIPDSGIKFTIPKLGEKKKLLELSQKNVAYFKREKLDQYEKLNPGLRTDRLLAQMMKDLRLNQLPKHIECFDNSNFQGKFPVSAIVVFKNAKPSKKDYRHFNVKTVEGPDDFATMEEAVFRRYRRLLDEEQSLPQLIVIDGGKGQLSSAIKSLKLLGIDKQVTIIGIAKRLEEIYYPGDQYPLYLDKKSETLKIIQQLRDEAHRFGITFHRKKRNNATLASELESIPGVGKASAEKLLRHFRSVKKIKEASEVELLEVLNKSQTAALLDYFK
ncbi:MAG: excinuclease ABC subunit C [Sphingobacteriales bacterium 17-39-43]|uniref:excinuclease ABC subunit UvrC n=1 Tax=Daejeonella sp. TaxID=2805397 RepID=UPI000BC9C6DA|nr:excinuclease ABC subunit UvrC [Daejeonella sp.]OYY06014.1 MAG: excinuclease ABC subunit C [Sphingobacteriia bacterium 35-40-5]OYZ31093.1 MAG: excinuclease ABC subunit C [Sphingobacteriales bacterium 16-39-50]OZA23934.1 MAG: excinuclease ABC subunit C [Sphingobacteriales bacterium 17-39-43]HQT23312.1 excinuclease ABC subunit UvrC [Daejeonella sp.]HQT58264.1 excinuclease ABC subunit UvrC [Daejeonella sp.]